VVDDASTIEIARRQGRAELLLELMAVRFGEVPSDVRIRVLNGTNKDISRWMRRALGVWHVQDVFREERLREELTALLSDRFPDLADHRWSRVENADLDELQTWLDRAPKATDSDDIFAVTCAEQLFDQGHATGFDMGCLQGFLLKFCTRKFGALPAWAEARIKKARLPQLDRWLALVFEVKELVELLGPAPADDLQPA